MECIVPTKKLIICADIINEMPVSLICQRLTKGMTIQFGRGAMPCQIPPLAKNCQLLQAGYFIQ